MSLLLLFTGLAIIAMATYDIIFTTFATVKVASETAAIRTEALKNASVSIIIPSEDQ